MPIDVHVRRPRSCAHAAVLIFLAWGACSDAPKTRKDTGSNTAGDAGHVTDSSAGDEPGDDGQPETGDGDGPMGGGDGEATNGGDADGSPNDASAGPDDASIDAAVGSNPQTDAGHDPEFCGDGRCGPTESVDSCCQDCGCSAGLVCTGGSCVAAPPTCGNGSCQSGESSVSCCQDCGCASGFTCTGGRCVRNQEVCGNGVCRDGESSASCCSDCGCPGDSYCEGATCQPRCGNGVCDGGETQASCCRDCGCAAGDYCDGQSCQCSESDVMMRSALTDQQQYCVSLGQWYTQRAVAYVHDGNGNQTYYIPQGGWVRDTVPLGTRLSGWSQCCMLDPCLGNLSCPTPYGSSACLCLQTQTWSYEADICDANVVFCQ
jgi:hypothetical protein